MRFRLFLFSLAMMVLSAGASQAVLNKFDVRRSTMLQYLQTSPKFEFRSNFTPNSTAVVDNQGGAGSPTLELLKLTSGGAGGRTTNVPGLSGFIWFNQRSVEGPTDTAIGTGDRSSVIDWGDVSGWTVTGGTFCHSVPSTICDLAVAVDSDTVTPDFLSSHYNLYSWTFHPTGFVADPFIHRTSTTSLGNLMWVLRGGSDQGGEVPALPLLGIGATGVAVLAMGVVSARRRK